MIFQGTENFFVIIYLIFANTNHYNINQKYCRLQRQYEHQYTYMCYILINVKYQIKV